MKDSSLGRTDGFAHQGMGRAWSRREFGRMLAGGALLARPARAAGAESRPVSPPPTGEPFWQSVRQEFLMPPDLAALNAANLCPSPRPVAEALAAAIEDCDRDPSPANRVQFDRAREATRRALAAFLKASPEEIVITRNTSEANNLVSSGLDLKAGDEVLIFSDNHPSNHAAWREKAARAGYTVAVVDQVRPHPGPEYYLQAFARKLTPRTKVLAFTHLTNTVGDLFPARELCRTARERNVLTLVDGAQSFGLMEVDLGDMQPDFYTASAHKWLCGPREVGLLYANRRVWDRVRPSLISHHPGEVGLSRTFEALGQRNDAAIVAFAAALQFQERIGRRAIEARARELAQALMEGLRRIPAVLMATHPSPERSVAVITIRPGQLDPVKLAAALYQNERIGCAGRPEGLRFSPHLYNSQVEVERLLSALRRYLATG